MNVTIKKVNPELAKKILKGNLINRKLSPQRVEHLSRQMKEGKWETNTGESIKISKNNLLLDGQHRLAAIIKANVEIDMLVVDDLDTSIINVIDTGKPRSVFDVLSMNKISNATLLSSIINYIISHDKNYSLTAKRVTSEEVLNEYRSNVEKYDTLVKNINNLYLRFDKLVEPKIIGATIHHKGLDYANKLFSKDETDRKINKIRKDLIKLKLSRATINKKIEVILGSKK
jgi:hypothetical protein